MNRSYTWFEVLVHVKPWSDFLMTVVKTQVQSNHTWPITANTDNATSQSQLEEWTCRRYQARENAPVQVTIGFWFLFRLVEKKTPACLLWLVDSEKVKANKHELSFDSQPKTALMVCCQCAHYVLEQWQDVMLLATWCKDSWMFSAVGLDMFLTKYWTTRVCITLDDNRQGEYWSLFASLENWFCFNIAFLIE